VGLLVAYAYKVSEGAYAHPLL